MGWQKTMREYHFDRFLLAFIISTFLFVVSIGFGSFLSMQKVYDVENMQYDLLTNVNSNDLAYLLYMQDPCKVKIDDEFNQELYDTGTKLSFMETQRGRYEKEVVSLREYYSLLEIKQYLFMEDVKEECSRDYNLILYFYEECDMCQDQGFLLKYFKEKYNNVYVYSFDFYSSNEAVQNIKKIYNITKVPSVNINGKTYDEFLIKEELERILKIS